VSFNKGFDIRSVCLKITGESLMNEDSALCKKAIDYVVSQIKVLLSHQIKLCLVLGGGNIYRGISGSSTGLSAVIADQVGMLATVMNALALSDALINEGVDACVYSAFKVDGVVKEFHYREALKDFNEGKVVLFCGGTGNPYFTTDTACVIRALEMKVDLLLKGTKVDGIYDKDPLKFKDAKKIPLLKFEQALKDNYQVMDMSAFALCSQYQLPLIIFNFFDPQAIKNIIEGKIEGTLVLP
jgi:uridylate kinase